MTKETKSNRSKHGNKMAKKHTKTKGKLKENLNLNQLVEV